MHSWHNNTKHQNFKPLNKHQHHLFMNWELHIFHWLHLPNNQGDGCGRGGRHSGGYHDGRGCHWPQFFNYGDYSHR